MINILIAIASMYLFAFLADFLFNWTVEYDILPFWFSAPTVIIIGIALFLFNINLFNLGV